MDSTRKESQRKTGQAERIKGGAARLTLVAIAMYGFLNFSPISAQPKDLEDPNRGSALSIAELPGPSSEFQINQPVLQEEEQQQDGYIIRGQTLPLGGGSNVEIREIDGGLVNQIGETLNRQPGYEGAKIIVGEYGQTLNILSTNTRTGALEFTYPHAPADFNWNEENRVWVRQADGKTVVYIPGIALPGAWDNQAGIAGPAAIPEAAVLVQTPEGNLQMAVVYDRSSIEGHALERPPIAIEGTNFDIVMGAFKNIELEEGQRLENIINPLTNQIIGYKVVNQDGSYLRMITSWEGVERPEDVSNLFEARGIVNMNGEEIPYPSERIVTQDQLNDPNLNVEQIGDLYYISNVTESESVVLRVTTGGSRIRQEPNTQSTVVTTVEINSEIEYVGEIEGQAVNGETTWYIIEIDGSQYYIHSSLVNRETRSEVQTVNLAVGLSINGEFRWFANEGELNSYLSEQGLVNADGLIIEDPRVTNPELFNLERPTSPIPQFVNAMRMAGIEVDPRGVVDNLRFRRIEGVNGEQFVIASYTITDSQNTPYTVAFIANRQENGWRWDRATSKIGEFFGITIGGSGNLGDSNHNDRRYINTIRDHFSLWVDTGSFMEMTIHQWPPDILTMPILFENRSLRTRIGPLFWHHDMPQNLSQTETYDYINHRINDFIPYLQRLRGRNVEILLANEPLWQWGSNQGWIDSPLYRAYGRNWITEAFVRLYTELQSRGLNYGTNYHVMLINEYDIEIPTPKANFIIQTVSGIQRDIEQRLGQNIDFTIGLQFHVGADADGYIRVDPNYLADERNIPTLINHFQRLSSLGRLSVTEFDFDGRIDSITQAKIVHNLFTAILQSGVFNDFTTWSTLRQNNDFQPNFFDLNTYQPTHNNYTLINAIIENSIGR